MIIACITDIWCRETSSSIAPQTNQQASYNGVEPLCYLVDFELLHLLLWFFSPITICSITYLMVLVTFKLMQVSNHVASLDDPLVIAALIPPSVLLDAQNLRWTLCASDHCFKNPVTSAFFKHVKVLPLTRGEGVYQKVHSLQLRDSSSMPKLLLVRHQIINYPIEAVPTQHHPIE